MTGEMDVQSTDMVPVEVRSVVITEKTLSAMSGEEIDTMVSKLGDALRRAEDISYHALGGFLHVVYRQQYFMDLNFDSFEDYCKERIGFSQRKALYLISIWEKFEKELKVPRHEYEGIEWSKLKEIVPVVNKENVNRWLSIARANTVEELRYQVRKELNPEEEEMERTIPMSIHLFPGEKEVVDRAFDVVRRMMPRTDGSEPRRGQCLEMICADFLAGVEEG
jgi:hypothetical protein